MSRSRYYSNQFATIQASAMGCKQEQEQLGGNFLKGFQSVLAAVAPIAIRVGEQAAIHHLTRGRYGDGAGDRFPPYNNIPGTRDDFGPTNLPSDTRKGGSFGNAALQLASVPSTSQARDLRGNGGPNGKKVRTSKGYHFTR